MRDFIVAVCLTLALVAVFSGGGDIPAQEQTNSRFSVPFGEPVQQPTEGTGGNLPVPPPTQQDDIEKLAWEVIRGLWDNGEERKRLLTEAGHDCKAVQQRVNEILGVR
jgi:hypothetical protein